MTGRDTLAMYTIYANPSDFPGTFVVREFAIVRGVDYPIATGSYWVRPSLDSARSAVAEHTAADHCIPRSADDEPHIVETWL